ncbi:MAG TPA: TonB-dependent receptor, partial [Methylophilaceae bacterium]|nr:TonB-dependent receptor [Methylophilaceae bacterium]
MKKSLRPNLILIAILSAYSVNVSAENKAEALELGTIDVISTTPLPGIGTTLNQVPSNVQSVKSQDIAKQHTLELSDYINNNLGGVTITEGQSNPYMADVNFRGFTASPLAGAPQGLSVFQDGVRINEPFGDTVNWGLIPQSAISSINLMPGSNPVFGLNTLGGALSVNTKSGATYPGFGAEIMGGSWGRHGINASYGGVVGNIDYFVTGNYNKEDGWRDSSKSEVNQFFGKVGWQDDKSDLDLSVTVAHNNLNGIQALPKSWLNTPEQAYTYPDAVGNRMQMINLKGSHFFTDEHLVGANVYLRNSRISNFASNTNDCFASAETGAGEACDQTLAEPVSLTNQGSNEQSNTNQFGYGFAAQYSYLGDLMKHKNQLTAGVSADIGRTKYKTQEQETDFSTSRAAVATDVFQEDTNITANNEYYGLYATDIFSINDQLHFTLSGRYNYVEVRIHDNLEADPNTGKFVSGDTDSIKHSFNRFNPAIGLNYNPSQTLGFYAGYNEGMRAPTPIELSCADPLTPCRLPTDFLADPILDPVISKTFELGARGKLGTNVSWNAGVFHTKLQDDIQFISSNNSFNLGYFDNVGDTQREGVELGLSAQLNKLQLTANYQYLRATYLGSVTFHNENNSSADVDGNYTTKSGDYLPNIPKHSLKLRVAYDVMPNLTVGLNMITSSSVYARGDENNQDANGKVAGYTIFNADANWRFHQNWSAFLKVVNLTDRDYATMGILGTNAFNTADRSFNATPALWQAEQFQSPGAPRAAWLGLRY